ncbi:hypothetical protein F3Y22_tig00111758pilonHSYRG00416 [Hibiscus syriacus]|uniref:DNA (Cytosine-5)-methyltransferase DRM1/2 n=1 Tax=Hibiscus syriacus TaxID=106335 RepID=A0A6A2YHQ8_HIBSY|nr:hypothetical protein F3Y22_tig00111758pilonHSYRG00416 [Hibiscus syriacus]
MRSTLFLDEMSLQEYQNIHIAMSLQNATPLYFWLKWAFKMSRMDLSELDVQNAPNLLNCKAYFQCLFDFNIMIPTRYNFDNVLLWDDFTDIDISSDTKEILNFDYDEENKLLYLTKMGYSGAKDSIAMERCDPDSSIAELTDFICSTQMVKATDALLLQRKLEKKLLNKDDHAVHLLNPMIGFGVPTEPDQVTQRTLLEDAIGPLYFYYENVELALVNVWTEMSRVKLTERICKALETYDDEPPLSVQKYVLDECRKWNLVWVGRNKVVPIEPDEVKILIGFPKNHTRGGGSTRDMFPGGINVLSLFSRISDAKVAFYCLGIPLKTDAQELNGNRLEQLMSRFGEFDLVVGGILLTVSSAASRYSLLYPTLPEPWKGLVDSKTGYLYFWNPLSNLLKDIMDIIMTRKMIDMKEVAMMYQDLSQYHGITRVPIVDLFIPIIHLNGTYSSVIGG